MANENQIRGYIYGGALGDAYGSAAEGQTISDNFTLDCVDAPRLTDDTQLTLAPMKRSRMQYAEVISDQLDETYARTVFQKKRWLKENPPDQVFAFHQLNA